MPIKKENKEKYPTNWKDIRKKILGRSNNCCEFCGIPNYSLIPGNPKGSKVVLTIAHLDHNPENCDENNLRALCQRCHLRYDAKQHAENAKITRLKKQNNDF